MKLAAEQQGALEGQIALAEGLLNERRIREALSAFDGAEAMGADPDGCSAARWMGAMLLGDFEAAWRENDAIRRRGAPDPHRYWMGEEIRGRRVMVRCLHGFGDAIQFLRFLPRLRAVAAQVIVEVAPRLLPLVPYLDGVGEAISWGELAPMPAPEWDVQVEVMELPYLFRVTERELPAATSYLQVPRECAADAARAMGARRGRRIGVVWVAGEWNRERSVPFGSLDTLLRSDGVEFWSLQGGSANDDAAEYVREGLLRDAAICGDGLPVLAGVIANLDLVITVDTLAAHMAGALGVPAWVMLQRSADWRWMAERSDSPWYPKMRLFRQGCEGDWNGVVETVRSELLTFCGRRAS